MDNLQPPKIALNRIVFNEIIDNMIRIYPNPFNLRTRIEYKVTTNSYVKIKIYDSLGRLVRDLLNEDKNHGRYSVIWDGKTNWGLTVSSGIYFCRVTIGNKSFNSRITVIK
jgi:flagellar hook assembly protein FlgD